MRVAAIRFCFANEQALHPYIQEGLKRNRLLPLRACQQKALSIIPKGNVLLNELDGSGKTLAYLLPIIDRILHSKKQSSPPAQSGAVILTLNKELGLQIYRQIRQLDFQNILNVNRSGSITHYGPVVEQMCKKREEQDQDLINQLMIENIAASVVWPQTDILISTPQTLYKILTQKQDNKLKINPEFLVVDDADVAFGRKEEMTYIKKNLEMMKKMMEKEAKLKVVMSSPFDGFLKNASSVIGQGKLQSTNYVESSRVIDKLKILCMNTGKCETKEQQFGRKLQALMALLKERVDKRVVIFCSSGGIERIKTALKAKLDVPTVEYFARLSSEKRMAAIFDFNFKKTKILLATELASRGFSFLPAIDCIISFDACEKPQEELVRMCRSNKPDAEYIIMGGKSQSQVREFLGIPTVNAVELND